MRFQDTFRGDPIRSVQSISTQKSGIKCKKDCRKRWFHSLDPALRKGRWSKEEDELLLAAYKRLGPAWKDIGKPMSQIKAYMALICDSSSHRR